MKKMGIVLSLTILVLLTSCLGVRVRDEVLMPLAGRVFEHIYPEIELGLEAGVAENDLKPKEADSLLAIADQMRTALAEEDRDTACGLNWAAIEPWATRGVQVLIDQGEITEGVATLLYQRIVNFRDLLQQLGSTSYAMLGPSSGGTRALRCGSYYFGQYPKLDMHWQPIDRHNLPRRALGVTELTALPVGA